MTVKPVTVSIDEQKLEQVDGWVRQGKYENRSRALEAALDLLLLRNARPTLAEALAHPRFRRGSPEWRASVRDSEAIDAEADAMNEPDPPPTSVGSIDYPRLATFEDRPGAAPERAQPRIARVQLLTSAQTAVILGITPVAVRDLVRRGKLRGTKIGRLIRIEKAEVE